MRMGQGVRTGLGHGGIICVLQTQFSSFHYFLQREKTFVNSFFASMDDVSLSKRGLPAPEGKNLIE